MAVAGFAIMAAYAIVLVLASRRSEGAALLRGEVTDERRAAIAQRASAVTLYVLIVVLLGGFVTQLVRGHSGHPWDLLCAVLGGTPHRPTVVFARRG